MWVLPVPGPPVRIETGGSAPSAPPPPARGRGSGRAARPASRRPPPSRHAAKTAPRGCGRSRPASACRREARPDSARANGARASIRPCAVRPASPPRPRRCPAGRRWPAAQAAGFGAEQVGRLHQRGPPRAGGCAPRRPLPQRVQDAGLEPLGGVGGDADGLGDLVGGLEADAPDLAGQAVGLLVRSSPLSSPKRL